MTIRHLAPLAIAGHQSSGAGTPDHPMRIATRRAAGLSTDGWTGELRHQVEDFFDDLAGDWHTRVSPQRTAIVDDVLARGLAEVAVPGGLAIEVGSGIGTYTPLLAARFARVLAIDLSFEMLRRALSEPAPRVQADGSQLPVASRSASAVVLINAFLFPSEVDRVLTPDGVLIWVNSSGEQTPIYLSPDDLVAALPGHWRGVASRAGQGHWCVLRREAAALLDELRQLEAEFHHPGDGISLARLEQLLHPEFHEVGRSGLPFTRQSVADYLARRTTIPPTRTWGHHLQRLADHAALLTYQSAEQAPDGSWLREARRSSVWIKSGDTWQIVYHQGTPS